MCEHEKSTLLHVVQSPAYHTRLITVASAEKKKIEDMPELSQFVF